MPALQVHCTENSKQIFQEMKLRGLVSNFYIHVSVSDLYIPTIGPQTQYRKIGGPVMWIYKLITDKWMQKRGHAVSFLGIFVSNFRCSGVGLRPPQERRYYCGQKRGNNRPVSILRGFGVYSCLSLTGALLWTPRRQHWTACVHFRDSYPIDVSHLSFKFLCLLLL